MRRTPPVETHGLTHVALAVRDPQRSLSFYRAVLGVVPVYEQQDFVQAQTPGSRDVLVFERKPRRAGKVGGIAHFGFRLRRPADIARALEAIRAAGGRIREHGEFVPGEPYVFFIDPDGYEVEILVRDSHAGGPAAETAGGATVDTHRRAPIGVPRRVANTFQCLLRLRSRL